MEIIFHPLVFKTKMCRSYLKNGVCCEYDVYCAKAHHPAEIRNLVEIYGEDWKRHYDLPIIEQKPDAMSTVESESIDKPKNVGNCYTCQIQGANSPLRIPKLASPVRRVESFNNHSSYISSPHLHGIYESVCYDMPELFCYPELSYGDLYDETAEMYEGCSDYTDNSESPVKAPSECSMYSIPTISSPEGSSASSTSNSELSSPSRDHSEICDTSDSDGSCMINVNSYENYDCIRKKLFSLD